MTIVRILAVTALAVAMPLQANPISLAVSHGDLNLASAKGRATLDRRIAQAVRQVCRPYSSQDLRGFIAARRCAISAAATARQQVDVAVARATGALRVAAR